MFLPSRLIHALCIAILATTAAPALAQTHDSAAAYPNRFVRILVQGGPGSSSDVRVRLLARKLAQHWGQSVVVDNRPGASGQVAMEQMMHAPADGYTLAVSGSGLLAIIPHLRKLPFDPLKDFTPVTLSGSTPLILVINSALPARNIQELIAYAKRNPRTLNAASPGNGTNGHLALVLFTRSTGTDIAHVPYKEGAGQMVTDLTGGQAHLTFDVYSVLGPYMKTGRLHALAVTSHDRLAVLPDVPTFREAGLPQLESVFIWAGFFAPRGTPRAIVDKINVSITKIHQLPDVRAFYSEIGSKPDCSTPEQLSAYMREEYVRWGKLITDAGIKQD